jgi:hypothetical protein
MTTSRPEHVPAPAERAYEALDPIASNDPASGWPLLRLLAAAGFGEVELWALAEDPGAAAWLAPQSAPAAWLPFVAQLVGARLTPTMSEQQQRDEISSPSGWRAGRPETIVATARRHMTGDRRVTLRMRYDPALGAGVDAPGHLLLIAHADDVLPGHAAALERDVIEATPAWLIGHVSITASRDYDAVKAQFPDYDAVKAQNADLDDLKEV